jgi:hypothetical protein
VVCFSVVLLFVVCLYVVCFSVVLLFVVCLYVVGLSVVCLFVVVHWFVVALFADSIKDADICLVVTHFVQLDPEIRRDVEQEAEE